MIEYIWRVNNLDVFYSNETNGGGDYFAIEYIDYVRQNYGEVDHILEWCSGPGFIGFGMLGEGLCNRLSLNEMYFPAVEMMYKTRQHADNPECISIYHGDTLDNISNKEQYDLVVGNPPHWHSIESAQQCFPFDIKTTYHVPEILIDFDWKAHKDFYRSIKQLLKPNGKIILQENMHGSNASVFEPMINESGLEISRIERSNMYEMIYYIEVIHK